MVTIVVLILTGLVLLRGVLHNVPGLGPSMERFAGWLSGFDVVIGVIAIVLGILEILSLEGILLILAGLILAVSALRARSLRLAGRVGDGTILTGMSSPAYVRWAREQIHAGMAEVGRQYHRVVVYLDVKVGRDGSVARAAMRRSLGTRLPWADVQLNALGIAAEVASFIQARGPDGVVEHMPEEWVDAFSAAGTPEQVADGIQRLIDAGADSVVFQPLDGDADCLDEYIRYLMPRLKTTEPVQA